MKTLYVVFVSLGLLMITSCQDKEAVAELENFKANLQQLEKNKAVAERFHYDLSLNRKWDVADEFIAPDIILHLPGMVEVNGIEALKSFDEVWASMKNPTINHYEIIAEGDYVFIRWDMAFDNTVDFMGIPATGEHISDIGGMDLFLIKDGKIKEFWQFYDELEFMKQLGAIPSE